MAPRGRSRKVGTARIDAALDAMEDKGYPRTQVRAMVNKLLRVYGGVEGYYFIEQNGYMVLIDALTEGAEKKYWEAQSVELEASTKQGDSSDGQRVGDDVTAGPAGDIAGSSNSHSAHTPLRTDLAEAEAEGDTSGGEDTFSQSVEATAGGEDNLRGLSLLASCAASLKPTSGCDDSIEDEDDDVASLPPAAQLRRSKRKAPSTNVQLRRSKRKLGSDDL